MDLAGLDIIVLAAVVLAALLGARKGFVAELLSLFAWVAMVFALKAFHLPLSRRLIGPVGTESGAAVLALVLIAGVTYVLGRLVSGAVGARTRTSVLGPVDRALGFGFGALKGLLLMSLLYLLAVLVLDLVGGGRSHRPAWLVNARTYPLLGATSASIAEVVARRRRGEPMFGPTMPDNAADAR